LNRSFVIWTHSDARTRDGSPRWRCPKPTGAAPPLRTGIRCLASGKAPDPVPPLPHYHPDGAEQWPPSPAFWKSLVGAQVDDLQHQLEPKLPVDEEATFHRWNALPGPLPCSREVGAPGGRADVIAKNRSPTRAEPREREDRRRKHLAWPWPSRARREMAGWNWNRALSP
jgi:hypothetical protein